MNCYDLTLEFIRTIDEIQRVVDKKSKASKADQAWLDKEIDKLEIKMFEIKKTLKNTNVY